MTVTSHEPRCTYSPLPRRRVALEEARAELTSRRTLPARSAHSGNRGRLLRKPPTQPGGSAACGARRSRPGIGARQPLWVTHTHHEGRRRRGGARARGAWRRRLHRRLPRMPSHIRGLSAPRGARRRPTPCNAPTLPCYRALRGGSGDDGGIEPVCTDAPDGAPPLRGTQRRTRHRRVTTVSSTSSCRRRRCRRCRRRRRRRRLLGIKTRGGRH